MNRKSPLTTNISKISTQAVPLFFPVVPAQHRNNRRWWTGILCLALIVSLFSESRLQADEAADQYNLAVGLYKQKRWPLSSEAFGTFVKKYPEHSRIAAAKLYWGLALVKQQEYAQARNVLRNFVVEHPDSKYLVDVMYQLAECSYLLNDLSAADGEFEKMLTKYPKHALVEWALTYQGDARLRTKKPVEALKSFEQAQQKYPDGRMQEDIRFGLAQTYAALKRTDEAITLYQQLSQNRNGQRAPQSLLNLGALYYSLKQYQQSIDTYKKFEQQFPQNKQLPTAQLNIGFGLFQLKDFAKAIFQFERTASTPEYADRARYWKAHCYKGSKDYQSASQQFKELATKLNEDKPESLLTAQAFYHWADCEQRLDHLKESQKIFLQVADNWPKFKLAPNALHYATLATFQSGDEQHTGELLDRFEIQFPDSGLKPRQRLLRARWLASKGSDAELTEAREILTEIRGTTQLPRTKGLAGLHLAHALTQLEESEPALKLLSSLLNEEKQALHPDEVKDALFLTALNHTQLKQFPQATENYNRYLAEYPDDERNKQIRIELLQIYALTDQKEEMRSTFETLKKSASQEVNLEGLRQAAEKAYDQQQWQQALTLFTLITDLTREEPNGSDLSGLAWSQYKLINLSVAANTFEQIQAQFPDDEELAPEAGYMLGKCLEEQNEFEKANEAYQKLFQKWAPAEPDSTPKASTEGATSYAYLSALQSARLAKASEDYTTANQWYQRVTDRFPANDKLDQILDEWAIMNVEIEDFTQADNIFKQLVQKVPDSLLADNARLSLAESQYLMGETEAAKLEFQQLVDSDQSDIEVKEAALYQLINITNGSQNWSETLELTSRFIIEYPQSEQLVNVLLIRTTALFENQDYDLCKDLLTKLKDKLPVESRPASVWILMAEILVQNKEYSQASSELEDFRTEFESRQDQSSLYLADELTGRIAKNQAQFDEARTAFKKVLEHEDGRHTLVGAKSQFFIAETYMIQKEYEKAQLEYLKVYLRYKDYPDLQAPALFQTGRCDEALGKPEKAKKAYLDLIEEFPDSEYKTQAEERLRVVENGQTE